MKIKQLDTVVLTIDLPEHGLVAGDIGAVVEVYPQNSLEVEFVTASGDTRALVTLGTDRIRPIGPNDILAVRKQNAA